MARNKIVGLVVLVVVIVIGVIAARTCFYSVRQWEQAVVTEFGKPVATETTPGLKLRKPFIQEVHRFSKRILAWDGDPDRMPTKDKKNIYIDCFARWRIVDPKNFLTSVRSIQGGQQRLDGRIDSALRDVVGRYDLIEVVRSTNRKLLLPEGLEEGDERRDIPEISVGRERMESEILKKASEGLEDSLGIELVDVCIKRINYVASVQRNVDQRMISERERIAQRYLSEAHEQRARILGDTQKELATIEGDGYQKSTETKGKADAEAMRIYAEAISQAPEFYAFLRTLEAYRKTLGAGARLVLTTDSEFFKYLKGTATETPSDADQPTGGQ